MVVAHRMGGAVQRGHALDGQQVGADAADAGTHGIEHVGQVLHMGLAGGVAHRVWPWLTTAAISTCSVPVTEGSSKNISAPVSGPFITKS